MNFIPLYFLCWMVAQCRIMLARWQRLLQNESDFTLTLLIEVNWFKNPRWSTLGFIIINKLETVNLLSYLIFLNT